LIDIDARGNKPYLHAKFKKNKIVIKLMKKKDEKKRKKKK